MESLKALMSKKVAGIPVIYIVGLFVAILAVVAWRMKPAAEPTEEPVDPTATEEDDPFGSGDPSYPGGAPTFVANPTPPYLSPDANQGPGSIDDNMKWLRRSIEWLVGQGHASVDQATVALQKYLSGEHLSVSEGKLRDLAISHYGLPPELPDSGGTDTPNPPLPPVPPVPPTPVDPAPETFRPPGYYTTKAGDTWTKLVTRFYGNSSNEAIDYLQSWNVRSGAAHSGSMPAGLRLWVPNYLAPKYIKATATMRTAADIIKKNPPLNSTAMLSELNDGMKFPVAIGTRVRVL
jgi:hypothetical protein